MKRILAAATLALTAVTAVHAAEDEIVIARPSFSVFHEFGVIQRGVEKENQVFEGLVLSRSGMMANFKATRNERLTLDALIGGVYWNPSYDANVSSATARRYFAASAPRAEFGYALGGTPEEPLVKITGGLFQHKYNENSRNLGEYMFRTTAYPSQVVTGGLTWVDVKSASVTGVKVAHKINETYSHELIANLETDYLPNYDISLSYMAKANFNDVFKAGVGVQLARILPVRPSITNPDIQYNRYFTIDGVTYIDEADYYNQRLSKNPGADSAKFERGKQLATDIDNLISVNNMTMSQALDSIARRDGVTSGGYDHYQTTAVKPVVTASFNPKPLLGLGPEYFNNNDLVLYGEASLLGIENQPVLYENRMERTVAMVGLNVPTMKILDVLAVEVEWFGSRQPNSSAAYQESIEKTASNLPLPRPRPSIFFGELAGYDPEEWKDDDIKWSVFAQRTLVRGLNAQVQVASDNARGWTHPNGRQFWGYFRSPSDWYWMMKITASI